jgi:hypothetical protein
MKITPKRRKEIERAVKAGAVHSKVAARYGISTGYVTIIARRLPSRGQVLLHKHCRSQIAQLTRMVRRQDQVFGA